MLEQPRLAPALAGALLLLVYGATLAPTVTLWDAGEFIAAVETLGIPHPPGTPLYVLVARVWSDALGFLPRALATNLFSAVATAGAAALLAGLLARATRQPLAGLAGAVCAGATATVWSNATETEVYAASLALALVMIVVAERAGRGGEARWQVLLAYLFALAVPLHMSALVAVPGAVLLAAVDENGKLHVPRALLLGGAGVAAAGAGMVSLPVMAAGIVLSAVGTRGSSVSRGVAVIVVLALGVSATLVLLVRSAHDPALDAGNPETWAALLDVIARRQYAPSGLWPRQAPLWIQMGNLIQYFDWQVAMGVQSGVGPSLLRTPITILYGLLGLTGCVRHARDDRRSWMALVVVFASATVGLVAYMNFKAGASFAWSFVPDGAGHEVRERDYFFALGFFIWGAWAGYGAVRLLSRRRLAWLGAALACAPIVLNWRVANRRRLPEASLAHVAAQAWLAPLPERAVLITGGDNDSFPLWYLQLVEGVRPDVTVITSPLLGADWYRAEVAQRHRLLPVEAATSRMTQGERLRLLAHRAASMGRPLAVSAFLDSARRAYVARSWRFDGMSFHADSGPPGARRDPRQAARVSGTIPGYMLDREPLDTPDRAPRFMARTLRCPSLVLRSGGGGQLADSLDSTCNFR
ncbi:MAG TPA: DUF2723 domain-containing protein [Gemmatimonadaceae bacterium]